MITIKSRLKITAALLALLLLAAALLPLTAQAAGTTITEYPVLTAGSGPRVITTGPDHALWFTELYGNQIGRIDPSTHAVTEYGGLTAGGYPMGITTGPDVALWFTEYNGNRIGRINPSTHVVTEYTGLTAGSEPWGITTGPDHALWFTEYTGSQIGRINPSTHHVDEYGLTAGSGPFGITSGPDGALWFTEYSSSKIGRIDPSTHVVTEYPVLTAGSEPYEITSGPDGALWFTEYNGNLIGRIDPTTHVVTEYGGLTAGSGPFGITSGPDGALWFTEVSSSKIGRIDPSTHVVTEYTVLTAGSKPEGITSGTDGALWFTENTGNKIGRVSIPFTINASVSGGHGTVTPATQTVNSAGTATIGINPDTGYHTASVRDNGTAVTPMPTTSYTIHNMAADHNVVVTFASNPSSFYFAEGYTGPNFAEYLTLGNPNAAAATATVTYMFPDGTTKNVNYPVPATGRTTVNVNSEVGPNKEVSIKVQSDTANLVAERPMYFNYNGLWTGGSDAVGATSPNTKWYFAEGNTLPGFDEYVTVLNPGSTAANLTFHYMVAGQGEKDAVGSVGAHSRATFNTRSQIGPNLNASLYLSSSQAVVAERPMYFDYEGLASDNWTGGHDVVGANSPNTKWYFAEGTTRAGFEEWLTLQNPASSPITVNARYLLGPGQGNPIQKSYTVPAKQRLTVPVNTEIGTNKDDSVQLTSTGSFIAERPMYFNYQGAWTGGSDVLGANGSAKTWFFAEGTTRDNFAEWLCLQNPGNSDAHATITYYTSSGQAINKSWTVSANSRLTVNVNSDAGANQDISAKVSSDKPIITERPMYFDYNGWTGGHDVVGFVPQ